MEYEHDYCFQNYSSVQQKTLSFQHMASDTEQQIEQRRVRCTYLADRT